VPRVVIIALGVSLGLLSESLPAQEYPTPYEYSTSSAPATVTYFNFDITDSIYVDSVATHVLIYRDQPAAAWNSADISLLYQTCSTFTYSDTVKRTTMRKSDLLDG
jgi:hypothetical protein